MRIIDNRFTKDEEQEEKPDLRLLRGGKEPPGPPSVTKVNWLMTLPVDTVFISKLKTRRDPSDFTLNEYCVVWKGRRVANLVVTLPNDTHIHIWVDSIEFSNDNELMEVVRDGAIQLADDARLQESVGGDDQVQE